MIKPMFSVFDAKARVFSSPFLSTNEDTAIRDFKRAATDPQTDICRFPSDYDLYRLGTFNDENSDFELITPPVFVVAAKSLTEV